MTELLEVPRIGGRSRSLGSATADYGLASRDRRVKTPRLPRRQERSRTKKSTDWLARSSMPRSKSTAFSAPGSVRMCTSEPCVSSWNYAMRQLGLLINFDVARLASGV